MRGHLCRAFPMSNRVFHNLLCIFSIIQTDWMRLCFICVNGELYFLSMSKCAEIYEHQSWYGSGLSLVQRSTAMKYPSIDFHFWVMYGAWSFCADCGSYWFNDEYFRQRVYQDRRLRNWPMQYTYIYICI